MGVLRFIYHDQLNLSLPVLQGCDKKHDVILMCENQREFSRVKHHKKKLAFWLSIMRHFRDDLQRQGYTVEYVSLDDPRNSHDYAVEIQRCVKYFSSSEVIVMQPSDYTLLEQLRALEKQLKCPFTMVEDGRFLASDRFFSSWAESKKQLRMEFFYREMRREYDVLMKDGQPEGGKWNYDAENRKPPKSGLKVPATYQVEPDEISKTACDLVEKVFPDHFGDLQPFYFAVNREQALAALDLFIQQRLIHFGDYQDAMLEGQPWMYHSHISFYLNTALLLPLECIEAAESAYVAGKAPLNAVEGFIRQILGWREFIRGIYWYKMPDYESLNFLDAKRDLPDFYWTADTTMNCLKQCVTETKQNAYAHHIQRLMVLGNFALIAGLHPRVVNEWYHIVYADAYQWVELPNVSGMILFADGGYLGSKPYAASGAYINKMSDYCRGCQYNVKEKNGPNACPFNYLYWDFLQRNRSQLSHNQRLRMVYSTLSKMDPDRVEAIDRDSRHFLEALSSVLPD